MLVIFFISFPILPCPIRPHATIIECTKPHAKPIKFVIKLYINQNTLLDKFATYQKPEFLKAYSQTIRSTATLSSIQRVLNSLLNGRCSFIFQTLPVFNHPYDSCKKIFLDNFQHPLSSLLNYQIILTIPINTPFFYT